MKKRLLSILSVIVLSFSLAACSSNADTKEKAEEKEIVEEKPEETKEEVKEEVKEETKGTIKVATSGSFYPVIFTEDDQLQGFEYDVWEEIGKRIGYDIDWNVVSGMDGMFGSLDAGKVDTISNQVSITPERLEKYNFSDVYAYNEIKLVVRADDEAEEIKDMAGKKVCIEPSSVLSDFVDNYNKDLDKEEQIIPVITEGSIYEELEMGRIDAFPMTVLSFSQVKEKGEYDVKMIGEAMITEENAYPFSKEVDQELVDSVNNAINEMHEDGTLSQISDKWYKRDVTKGALD